MPELGFKYLLFISLSTKTVNIPFSEAKKVEAKSKKLPGPGWLLENRLVFTNVFVPRTECCINLLSPSAIHI